MNTRTAYRAFDRLRRIEQKDISLRYVQGATAYTDAGWKTWAEIGGALMDLADLLIKRGYHDDYWANRTTENGQSACFYQ